MHKEKVRIEPRDDQLKDHKVYKMHKERKIKKLIILIQIITIIILLSLSPQAEQKYYLMTATAYCPCEKCCGKWAEFGLTSEGYKAGRGNIAIDPQGGPLEMGQIVWVEGYGYGVCSDTGSAIKGWRVDLGFNKGEHYKALKYGVELVRVYILED